MSQNKIKIIFTLILFTTSFDLCTAIDWPNWRGPHHNGISNESGWFKKWPASGPNKLWKTSVGTGFANVSIADGRVFTMGNKSNRDQVIALDDVTGNE